MERYQLSRIVLKDFTKKHILGLIIFFAAVVYISTALNSHGFYHADEHYQIIEFAGLKLGTQTPNELAWEFKAQIRPTLQPVICLVLLRVFDFLNIDNPYNQTFLIRLLSAILALCVITYFVLHTRKNLIGMTNKMAYYLLSYFLWFIPFISVRFSSETWSGLLFLLSLAIFHSNTHSNAKPFILGLILGASFLFRFQIAFALFGFVLWLIFINHSKLKYLLNIAIAFFIIVLFGFLLDSWFYDELVFTPWKYFYKNIIEGAASGFGTSPWYFYFTKVLRCSTYFIGIPIVLSFILLLFSNPKNYLLWCTIPFIVGHSIISHKEIRFLFPIVYLIPLMLIESYLVVNKLIVSGYFNKTINKLLIITFIVVNTLGIIAMGHKSAGIGRMEITKYIHDNYGYEPINLIYTSWANPYNPWHSIPAKFYLEDIITEQRIKSLCELSDTLFVNGAVNLLAIRKSDAENYKCKKVLNTNSLVSETQSVPKWIENINTVYGGFDNKNILELYKYKPTENHIKKTPLGSSIE